jgi:hypothetical protein
VLILTNHRGAENTEEGRWEEREEREFLEGLEDVRVNS